MLEINLLVFLVRLPGLRFEAPRIIRIESFELVNLEHDKLLFSALRVREGE